LGGLGGGPVARNLPLGAPLIYPAFVNSYPYGKSNLCSFINPLKTKRVCFI
jgi:hypothetical protein